MVGYGHSVALDERESAPLRPVSARQFRHMPAAKPVPRSLSFPDRRHEGLASFERHGVAGAESAPLGGLPCVVRRHLFWKIGTQSEL